LAEKEGRLLGDHSCTSDAAGTPEVSPKFTSQDGVERTDISVVQRSAQIISPDVDCGLGRIVRPELGGPVNQDLAQVLAQGTLDHQVFVRNLMIRLNRAESEYEEAQIPWLSAPQRQRLERMIKSYFKTLALWPQLWS
jgi:hypothetical protein